MLKLYYFLQARVQAVELKLSQKIQKKLDEPYGSSVFYFSLILANLLLVIYQISFDLLKFVIILTRDPGISFNIFFKQRELRSCPFSYHDYKGIQQKVRMFSLMGMTAMVIVAVVSSIVTNLIFGGKNPTFAATATFVQNSWTTQDAVSVASHNVTNGTPEFNWNKYLSKDQYLSISGTGNNLSLLQTKGTSTQTSEVDFLAGAFTNATTTGSGGVKLAVLATPYALLQTNDTATTPSPSALTGGFDNRGVSPYTGVAGMSNVIRAGTSGTSSSVMLTTASITFPASTLFQTFGTCSGYGTTPWDINDFAIGSDNNVYILNNFCNSNQTYRKLNQSGTQLATLGQSTYFPYFMALDSSNNSYYTNWYGVQKYNPSYAYVTSWSADVSNTTHPSGPMVINSAGNLYMVSQEYNKVYKYNKDTGALLTSWGATGSSTGQFSGPRDIALDASGNVYVADSGNHRIQVFDSSGNFLSQWGSAGTGDYQFTDITAIAIAANGKIFVHDITDYYSSRILAYTSDYKYFAQWAVPHPPQNGYGVTMSRRLKTDSASNVYYDNGWIVKFTPGVNYSTPGTYVSYVDAGVGAISYAWNSLVWNASSVGSGGSTLVFYAKTSTSTTAAPSFTGCTVINGTAPGCVNPTQQYLWYQAALGASTDTHTSPVLNDVTANVSVNSYPSSGTYTSSPTYLGQAISSWDKVNWTNSGGQTVSMKVRTGSISGYITATTTYTMNTSGSDAWQTSSNSLPATPTSAGWANISDKTALVADDNNRQETRLTNGHGQFDYQLYRFKNIVSAASTTNLAITLNGYGEGVATFDNYLYVWNFNNSSWQLLDQKNLGTDGNLLGSLASNIGYYISSDGNNYIYIAAAAKHNNYSPTVSNAGRTPVSGADLGQATSANLAWSDWSDPDGDIPEYQVQLFSGASCAGAALQTRSYNTANSWAVSGLTTGQNYSWQVQARSGASYGDASAANTCYAFSTGGAAVTGVCGGDNNNYLYQAPTSLCTAGTATAISGSGPWTWVCNGLNGGSPSGTCTTYLDYDGNGVCGPQESCDVQADCGACSVSSCPLLYSWNGTKYEYQTDFQSRFLGKSDRPVNRQVPGLYDIATATPQGDKYTFNLREGLAEADFLDELKLWVVDVPQGYQAYTNWTHYNDGTDVPNGEPSNQYDIFTVKDPVVPVSVIDKYKVDVTNKLTAIDNVPAPESMDKLNQYTIDFGKVKHPENAKLIISAWAAKGKRTGEKVKTRASIIEVMDKAGQWQQVKTFGEAAGDLKPFVVNIPNIWLTDDYRIRLTPAYSNASMMLMDKIELDDSVQVPFEIKKLEPTVADLRHAGSINIHGASLNSRMLAGGEYLPDQTEKYFYGDFTKYGDIKPLLTQSDNKFAIFRNADEVYLEFAAPAQPEGINRKLFFFSNVFYVAKFDAATGKTLSDQLGQLPFNGMKKYPYDSAVENYPQDQEHQAYLKEWNTRVCEKGKNYCYDKNTNEKIYLTKSDQKSSFFSVLLSKTQKFIQWTEDKLGLNRKLNNSVNQENSRLVVSQVVTPAESNKSTLVPHIKRSLNADFIKLEIGANIPNPDISWASDWANCASITVSGTALTGPCIRSGDQYWQYQATLSTASSTQTPSLDQVDLTYYSYPSQAQSLYSSYYNTGSDKNLIGQLTWKQTLNNGAATVAIRTSGATSTLSSATWYEFSQASAGCSVAGDTVTCPKAVIPAALKDLTNDQYFQYKVALTGFGSISPSVSEVNVQYVVNKPPEFNLVGFGTNGVKVYQATTTQAAAADVGKVMLQYQAKDQDGDTGNVHASQVQPSFKYNIGTGWLDVNPAFLVAGDTSLKTVSTSTYNTFSATWDARGQLGTTTDLVTAQLQVIVDDGEANGTALASASFWLDTRPAVLGTPALVIKATSTPASPANITINATESSASFWKMRLATSSTAYNTFSTALTPENLDPALWENYATSKVYASASSTVYIQFLDQYGNISAVGQSTPPAQLDSFMVQDTSNIKNNLTDYRLFISWKIAPVDPQPSGASFKQYNIYRSTDEFINYGFVASSTRLVNFYTNDNLDKNTIYFYKVFVEDAFGNYSPFSDPIKSQPDGIQNWGEGGGGTLPGLVAPDIANVTKLATTSSGITITWTTASTSADSTIDYTTTPGGDWNTASSIGLPNIINDHSVSLSNLTASTTYYFRVRSMSALGMVAVSAPAPDGYSFTTLSGARITQGSVSATSTTDFTSYKVTWTTDQPTNSYVGYDSTSTMATSVELGSSALTTDHSVTLVGLTPGKQYWFYVKSGTDQANNGGSYYIFSTGQDSSKPLISNLAYTTTPTTANLTWLTANKAATSTIRYGTSTLNMTYDETTFNINHNITLSGLTSQTSYNFQIVSGDGMGNLSTTTSGSFVTSVDRPTIINLAVSAILPTSATVSWNTDVLADSTVFYSTVSANIDTNHASSTGVATMVSTSAEGAHQVVLIGLNRNTTYYYVVKSTNALGNPSYSVKDTFQTVNDATINLDTVASSTDNTTATIRWMTDNPANSYVDYADNPDMTDNSHELGSQTATTSHRVLISGLTPGTTYWFFIKSGLDRAGYDIHYSFTTTNIQDVTPPEITFNPTSDITSGYNSARITWRTNDAATSTLHYSSSTAASLETAGEYQENTTNSDSLNTSHAFDLHSLTGNTTYYIELLSRDAAGNLATTTSQFTTVDVPDTTGPVISYTNDPVIETTVNGATLNWQTDEDSSSYVQYATSTTNFATKLTEIGKDEATKDHTIELLGLTQGQTYYIALKSVDLSDNKNKTVDNNHGNYYSFTTKAGPEIDVASITTSTTDTTATIGWNTVVNADAYVSYSTSPDFSGSQQVGALDRSTKVHELTLINLSPGLTYYFRIRSTDADGGITSYPTDSLTFTTGNTAPQIIGAVTKTITAMPSIIFSWLTNKAVTSTISYYQDGQSQNVTTVNTNEAPTTNHFFDLGGLLSSVKYYYNITLFDTAGNTTVVTPEDNNFELPDNLAPVIASTTVMQTLPTSAIIGWQTDEAATAYIQYSTSPDLATFEASTTPVAYLEATSQNLSLAPSLTLSGLEQGTTYYYRVRSTDSHGNQSEFKYSDDSQTLFSFQTIAGPSINNVQIVPPSLSTTTISWDTGASSTNAIVTYDTDPNFLSAKQVSDMTNNLSHALELDGLSPNTTYYFKVHSTDENGSATELTSQSQQFTTSKDIVGPTILFDQQTDLTGLLNTSATLSWTTDEPATSTVYYGTNQSDLNQQLDNVQFNFNWNHDFKLTGLTPGTVYYFKLVSSDSSGNRTEKALDYRNDSLTFTTLATADTRPPVISGVEPINSTVDSITIRWQTKDNQGDPEAASSFVQLASSHDDFDASFKEYGKDELVTDHSVMLDSLTQNQTYYYRVRSTDKNGNVGIYPIGSSTLEFKTNPGPVILVGSVSASVATGTVVINWATEDASSSPVIADSYVMYDLNPDFSNMAEQGTAGLVADHHVSLTNLAPNQTYYYKVKSRATNGGVTILADESFTFTTLTDNAAPTITFDPTADIVNLRDTQATLNWQTSEQAVAMVNYDTSSTTDPYRLIKNDNPNLNYNHSFTLSGLATSTTYYFRLLSVDASSNSVSKDRSTDGTLYSFTTLSGPLQTSEQANADQSALKNELNTTKAELAAAKAALDASANSGQSNQSALNQLNARIAELEKNLETEKQKSGGGVMIIDKTDKVAPKISDIQVSDLKADRVTITWKTSEDSYSLINYNGAGADGSFGNWLLKTSHTATIKLEPGTTYTYQVGAVDGSGNLSKSESLNFTTPALTPAELASSTASTTDLTGLDVNNPNRESLLIAAANRAMEIVNSIANTVSLGILESTLSNQYSSIEKLANSLPAPVMGGEPGVVTTATTATITWRTDKDSNSTIAYSPDNVYQLNAAGNPYQQVVGDATKMTKTHQVVINGLKPSTFYHYQLRSKANIGPEAKSRDFTFKTNQETPEVSDYAVQNATAEKAVFKWITNVETDSQLTYIPYRNNKLAVEEAQTVDSKAMTTVHELTVDKFEGGTIYQIELTGKDTKGNMVSKTIDTFSTSKDDLPPIITQVQTESALSQGKDAKVQTIISWSTNEPTLGQVMYEKGVTIADSLSQKTPVETSYGRKHVMVVTKFDSGEVYSFRVMATDSAGNTTLSKTFTILTPKQKESVFQLILKNFESTFGWVGQIGQ